LRFVCCLARITHDGPESAGILGASVNWPFSGESVAPKPVAKRGVNPVRRSPTDPCVCGHGQPARTVHGDDLAVLASMGCAMACNAVRAVHWLLATAKAQPEYITAWWSTTGGRPARVDLSVIRTVERRGALAHRGCFPGARRSSAWPAASLTLARMAGDRRDRQRRPVESTPDGARMTGLRFLERALKSTRGSRAERVSE
jgi:hypothetical protein